MEWKGEREVMDKHKLPPNRKYVKQLYNSHCTRY
jgi:hypothetical protein